MSVAGSTREWLNKVADMGELSGRERTLARFVFCAVDGLYSDVLDDRKWYGAKAIQAFKEIYGDDLDALDDIAKVEQA